MESDGVPAPGTALLEELDNKVLIQLRDGRKLIGMLRSFDQFSNLVLEGAIERIIVGQQYSDISLGWQLIRGENVVLMGQIDPEKELPSTLQQVPQAVIVAAQRAEKEAQNLAKQMRSRMDFLDLE